MGCHTWFYRNKKELEETVLDCPFHDVFRIGGYPETILNSLDETIQFMKDNKCRVFERTDRRLKEFWEKYPDGKIDFG